MGNPDYQTLNIGILAVQGAFAEHRHVLEGLGARCIEIRQGSHLNEPLDGIVLPGGESTVQGKLLHELGMLEPLRRLIWAGVPVLATCAGMILLAQEVEQGEGSGSDCADSEHRLATMPVCVCRNAYGRQLGSFSTKAKVEGIGVVPMTFIRAPYVRSARPGVQVLAKVEERIVAVRYGNQMALSFHPELDETTALHEAFLDAAVVYRDPLRNGEDS